MNAQWGEASGARGAVPGATVPEMGVEHGDGSRFSGQVGGFFGVRGSRVVEKLVGAFRN